MELLSLCTIRNTSYKNNHGYVIKLKRFESRDSFPPYFDNILVFIRQGHGTVQLEKKIKALRR